MSKQHMQELWETLPIDVIYRESERGVRDCDFMITDLNRNEISIAANRKKLDFMVSDCDSSKDFEAWKARAFQLPPERKSTSKMRAAKSAHRKVVPARKRIE